MIDSFKDYVPRYYSRTVTDHDDIRRRIAINPAVCKHLKGGRFRRRNAVKDYNVSHHRFIDGTERIRCHSCGTKWFSTDANWNEALAMTEGSTNSPSLEMPVWQVREADGSYKTFKTLDDLKKA